jgi:hypothetical protein
MSDVLTAPALAPGEPAVPQRLFVRGPLFDVVMQWAWLPFLLWLLTTDLMSSPTAKAYRPAFDAAMVAVLSVSFIHRHFVYLLFFGDAERRQRHPLATWAAPLVALVMVAVAYVVPPVATGVVILLGGWNIWHTLMQRHGLSRAYAVSLSPTLATAEHGRRELAVLWSATITVAIGIMRFQTDTFFGPARKVWLAMPLVVRHEPALLTALLVAAALVTAVLVWRWWQVEQRADVPQRWRWPRASMLASTTGLLLVLLLAGPIVGYIVFGFAHAVEYIMFAHAFSARQAQRGNIAPGPRLLAVPLFLTGICGIFLLAFIAARQVWNTPLFVAYFSATSLLHYVYDGLIWRRRRPAPAR